MPQETLSSGDDIDEQKPESKPSSFTANDGLVVTNLKALYKNKVRPIEKATYFSKFHHSEILDSELQAKPIVLLVGQYSTGKTSFIKKLIGCDYPGIHIGPEVRIHL
jgi:polynucleotide 5'-kinase involved in rRNA processing